MQTIFGFDTSKMNVIINDIWGTELFIKELKKSGFIVHDIKSYEDFAKFDFDKIDLKSDKCNLFFVPLERRRKSHLRINRELKEKYPVLTFRSDNKNGFASAMHTAYAKSLSLEIVNYSLRKKFYFETNELKEMVDVHSMIDAKITEFEKQIV